MRISSVIPGLLTGALYGAYIVSAGALLLAALFVVATGGPIAIVGIIFYSPVVLIFTVPVGMVTGFIIAGILLIVMPPGEKEKPKRGIPADDYAGQSDR